LGVGGGGSYFQKREELETRWRVWEKVVGGGGGGGAGGKAVNEVDAGRDRATPVARTADIQLSAVLWRGSRGPDGRRVRGDSRRSGFCLATGLAQNEDWLGGESL